MATPSTPIRQTTRRKLRFDYDSPRVNLARAISASNESALLQTPIKAPQSPAPASAAYIPKVIGGKSISSPLRNEPALSNWALTGTGPNSANVNRTPGKITRKDKAMRASARVDRFIPSRQNSQVSTGAKVDSSSEVSSGSMGSMSDGNSPRKPAPSDAPVNEYLSSVADAVGLSRKTRILEFQQAPPTSSKPVDLRASYNRPLKNAVSAQMRRKVPTAPDRVLDAPGLVDDYYLNLLDWSCANQVAIALEQSVYIWNASTGNVANLMDCGSSNYVSSVRWSGDGAYLSIGLSDGDVQIWDVEDQTKLRSMVGHQARVGVMSWNNHLVTSGCRDGSIWNHDVRVAQHKVNEFVSHTAEVCGLEWRSDGLQLASGGNDNLVNIWDARSSAPKLTKTNHRAAVKALAWCPWQLNLLATGGGSLDKHIHFWNSTTGARVNSIDAGSQVTSLKWSSTYKEIVSSHGFPDNHLAIWSYPSLTKNVEIAAHDSRVLHSALSPDGQTLATCASDENLKFWKIFESVGRKVQSAASSSLAAGKDLGKAMMIR